MDEIETSNFCLKTTLDSGQFFTYYYIDGWYYIVHAQQIIKIRQEKDLLEFSGINIKDLVSFLRLNDIFFDEILDGTFLDEAIRETSGLRILNQDLFQCIIGFMCSSAAPITKIKMNHIKQSIRN